MRKILILLAAALLLTPFSGVRAGAADGDGAATGDGSTFRPALVITKIAPDVQDGENGDDQYEAIELVNTSGAPLNLYEYALCYCGAKLDHENFGKVVEITPFLPGDFRDGSTWELNGVPQNPDTFVMEPGEVVVVWCWNNATVRNVPYVEEDFRSFWGLPETTRILSWDGNSDAENGGSDDNFALKNKNTGTYGVIRLRENLAQQVEAGEVLFDRDSECYVTLSFGEDILPDRAAPNHIAACGFDGVRNLSILSYGIGDRISRLGTLNATQRAVLQEFLPEPTQEPTQPTGQPGQTAGQSGQSASNGKSLPLPAIIAIAVAAVAVVAVVVVVLVKKKK